MSLSPGLYILTKDIDNPNVDRRVKYDWRYFPRLRAGTRFKVIPDRIANYESLRAYRVNGHMHQSVALDGRGVHDVLGALLADHLEPAPKTPENIIDDEGLGDWLMEFITYLVDEGHLSMERLKMELANFRNLLEEDDEKLESLVDRYAFQRKK